MFGGIVESTGLVVSKINKGNCLELTIQPGEQFDDVAIGDSVSVNGVCLTLTRISHDLFSVDVVPETLLKTNLGYLSAGAPVNLERSLQLHSRIGGHYVQGHVDFTATIRSIQPDGEKALIAELVYSPAFGNYLVNKGYVTLDGMSITIIEVKEDFFTVTFIPHTQAVTIVKHYQAGTRVNVEVDILGKYVEKMMAGYRQ